MWFNKNRLETPFIGDNVKALIKTSNCENMFLIFSEKIQKIATSNAVLVFSDQMVLASANDQKYPR